MKTKTIKQNLVNQLKPNDRFLANLTIAQLTYLLDKKVLLTKLAILLILATSCAPVCSLYGSYVKVVDYNHGTYTGQGVNENCFCSFRSDNDYEIGDTIFTQVIQRGDLVANIAPKIK